MSVRMVAAHFEKGPEAQEELPDGLLSGEQWHSTGV